METSFETETKNKTANTWAGFWFFIFIISLIVATWGEPDLIDAWIYYLSDVYYKLKRINTGISRLLFTTSH